VSKKCALVSLAAAAFAIAAMVPAFADGNFVLKASQGFNFARNALTSSDDPNADVAFARGALGARKIKGFGSQMPGLAGFNDIGSWGSQVNTPAPGYYVVQGHDGKTVYLVQVTSFGNQTLAVSKWELQVSWEKLW